MKLQRHLAYGYKGKRYYKNVIVIPDETVEKLGWNIGDELKEKIEGDALLLKATPAPTSKPIFETKDPYEEFRDQIEKLLKSKSEGFTWTEIRDRLKIPQKVPNNKWVRMMEKDIGLIREKMMLKQFGG